MKISIVTVAFNAAQTIGDTLASIRAQDFPAIEQIVIDGGSTDDTLAIARARALPGAIIESAPDEGIYDAMNKGVRRATGDLIGFLNADDFLVRRDALSLVAAAREKADAVAAAVAIVDARNPWRWRRSYAASSFRPWMLRFGHMPPHPGFYATRAMFEKIGAFRTDFRIGGDFEWLLRFHAAGGRACAIPQTIAAVRTGGASNSGLESRKVIVAEAARALAAHGRPTPRALLWAKYGVKCAQFLVPPRDYPAPADVRWMPDNKDSAENSGAAVADA